MESRTPRLVVIALCLAVLGCSETPGGDGDGLDGWAVILGGAAPDEGGYPQHPHCLYRVPLGGGASEELYCPDEARWIDWALPPQPGADELLFIAEVDAHSGIYGAEFPIYEPWVQELYRLDLSTGEPHLLGYYLADSFDGTGPYGGVYAARTLGDGRVAVHWLLPVEHGGRGEELVVVEADGSVGPDRLGGLDAPGLLAVLPDGDLLLRHADPGGRLQFLALDPDSGATVDYAMPADGPLSADVESGFVQPEPAGTRVLLRGGGTPTIASRDGPAQMGAALEFGEHVMGWAGDGGVLIERDDVVWWWDGLDGNGPVEIGTPDGADGVAWDAYPHPDGDQGAFFRAYAGSGDRDTPVWYRDGALVVGDTSVRSLQGESFAHGSDEPLALFHDSDWESSTRNQVFACRPSGECEEILTRHDLRGVLLPSGQIW